MAFALAQSISRVSFRVAARGADALLVELDRMLLRIGLVGEFDLPDQHSVAAQVRLYIYLGFGAEAAALLNAMSADEKDTPLWLAMAQIVDGEEVSENAFVGMAQCDTSAALWSLLATSVDEVEMANAAATAAAFSALPRHLRLALGPQVTDRLLALEQPDAVQGIVDAMERGTMTVQSATLLVASELDLHTGAVDTAVANAESAFDQGGVAAPDALVALVRAKVASGSTVERDLVVALAAMIDEYAGSAIAEDLAAAYLLALIGSGQYAAAMSSSDGPVPPVFWDYLAADGTDDELLQFAFVAPPIEISTASAGKIAQRLLSLGFNDAAREWRVLAGSGLPETIMENDDGGPHAIAGAPLPSTDATNENPDTARHPAVPDDGARTRRWQQDWEAIAQIESDPWNDLAVQITAPEDAADEPPLAEATRLVAGSKATREMLERLLRATAEQ
ncbi:MAG: hypothetical protein HC869_22885 [Rhodospirillales bacterium]|nr:hypothetical protein [Rhodospirillales bacterium]